MIPLVKSLRKKHTKLNNVLIRDTYKCVKTINKSKGVLTHNSGY